MSFILNALRKSEQERQAKQPESVTDRILIQHPPGTNRRTRHRVVAFVLLNLLVIAGGFYWFSQTSTEPASKRKQGELPDATAADTPLSGSNDRTAPSSNPLTPTRRNAAASIGEQATTLKRQEKRIPPHAVVDPQGAAIPNPKPSAKKDQPAAVRSETPEIPSHGGDNERFESVQSDAPIQKTPSNRDHAIPYLDELSYEIRRSVPRMTINAFVYTPDPNERFVIVNMTKYKAGQLTKDAVELKEIRRDSLVASFQGHTFQIERP
ncbi:MAG: general secretion pathway protein GspB [Gammaproteobacteria bacterium]